MSTQFKTRLVIAFGALSAASLHCVPVEQPQDPDDSMDPITVERVVLLDTEQLEPPAVGTQAVFKPGFVYDIDEDDPAKGQGTGFFLTVFAKSPEALKIRVTDTVSHAFTDLIRMSGPASASQMRQAEKPVAYNADIRSHLESGIGVFWIADTPDDEEASAHRIAVLLRKDLLAPFTRLNVFVSNLSGIPVGGARIELVDDFFYLAIIGDSILWGNGLREKDKMSALVADVIERELNKKVIQQRYAQSGAYIVPMEGDAICRFNCFGEAPKVSTSITAQVDQIQRPDLVDLVLADGCISDVGVNTILDPFVTEAQLTERITHFCEVQIVDLLRKVRTVAPQARLVVTGYFPIVGPQSDLLGLQQWTDVQGADLQPPTAGLLPKLIANSNLFVERASASLASAVSTVTSDSNGDPLVAFADPGFGSENAVFAPDGWLWSMTNRNASYEGLNLGLNLFPEDPISDLRLEICLGRGVVSDLIGCLYASVGHPNEAGARAYADSIIAELRNLGVLPE